MKKEFKIPVSETLLVAILLAFIGGFLEIYSFILKGNVFATTMTGNIILIFYHIYLGKYSLIYKFLVPLICFSIGVAIASYVAKISHKKENIKFELFILFIEIILVITLSMITNKEYNLIAICMISIISAMQIQTFSKVEGIFYMSTMCTGNTRKLIYSLVNKEYRISKIFASIILFFGLGVICGAILINLVLEKAILVLLIPLIIVFLKLRGEKNDKLRN